MQVFVRRTWHFQKRDVLMRNFRNPRYALESLESRLSPSTVSTSAVVYVASATPPSTPPPIFPLPGETPPPTTPLPPLPTGPSGPA